MVRISSCRPPCSAHAAVSPSRAHSFPVARKASGTGPVPPPQPIPHAASLVLMGALELQNPVGEWKKKEKKKDNSWGSEQKELIQSGAKTLVVRYTINLILCIRNPLGVVNFSQ